MAKVCKTVTISECPPEHTCNDGCVEIVKSKCIKYTGVNLPTLGINTGDDLDKILLKIETILANV